MPLLVPLVAVLATLQADGVAQGPGAAAPAQPAYVTSDDVAACGYLVQPTVIDQRSDFLYRYSYDQLTNSQSNVNANTSATAFIPQYDIGVGGKGAFSDEQKRMQQLGIKMDIHDSESYFARYLPQGLADDFVKCVDQVNSKFDGGVGISFGSLNGSEAHFTLHVRPMSGGAHTRKLLVSTNGNPNGSWKVNYGNGPADIDLTIDWPDQAQPLFVRARMSEGGVGIGTDAASYTLQPQYTQTVGKKTSTGTSAVRSPGRTGGNWGPPGHYTGNIITISAAPDEILVTAPVPENAQALTATKGAHAGSVSCNAVGVEAETYSDASEVQAHAFCQMNGPADENPGYQAQISVKTLKITAPIPNPSIVMIERSYPYGNKVGQLFSWYQNAVGKDHH